MIENYENDGPIKVLNKVYIKTFIWMFLGLLATGIVSVFTYTKVLSDTLILQKVAGFLPVVMIAEVVVVLVFSLLFKKLPPTVVAILYFIYAVINGITLSTIFFAYDINSVIAIFFVSSAVYAIFALIGMIVKIDLSKIGMICIIALSACVIISIVNLFLGVPMMDYIIDWIVLLLFFGITAYDMQKIRGYSEEGIIPDEKLHIYGAMQLYLDFINIFLRLLRIFGKRK